MNETDTDPEIQKQRAEIAATRARLAEEVDAIGERLEPEQLKHAAKEQAMDIAHHLKDAAKQKAKDVVKDTAHQVRETSVDIAHRVEDATIHAGQAVGRGGIRFGDAIRRNPVPAALVAGGIGYLIYEAITGDDTEDARFYRGQVRVGGRGATMSSGYSPVAGSRSTHYGAASGSTHYDLDDGGSHQEHHVGERVEQLGERVGHKIEQAKDAGRHAASAVASRATDMAEYVGDEASALARRTRRGAAQARRGTTRGFEAQPLLFGLGAFAIGIALGTSVRSTDQEDRWIGEAADRAKDVARQKVTEVKGALADAAEDAVETLTDELPSNGNSSKSRGKSTSVPNGARIT